MSIIDRLKKTKKRMETEKAHEAAIAADPWAGFDAETAGRITNIEKPMVGVQVITVEYEVDGEEYLIQEVVQAKNPPKRISVYPPLEKSIPKMGKIAVGTQVAVCYKPDEPEKAYVPKNQA